MALESEEVRRRAATQPTLGDPAKEPSHKNKPINSLFLVSLKNSRLLRLNGETMQVVNYENRACTGSACKSMFVCQ